MSTKEKSETPAPKEAKGAKVEVKSAATPSPSAAPVAAQAKKGVDLPPFLEFILIGATIISAIYLVGVYNPTEIRWTPPRTSRLSYVFLFSEFSTSPYIPFHPG